MLRDITHKYMSPGSGWDRVGDIETWQGWVWKSLNKAEAGAQRMRKQGASILPHLTFS